MRKNLLPLCGAILLSGAVRLPAAPAIPHPHDPVLRSEHEAMLELVRAADATQTAVKSGLWSDATTWKEGRVPAAGSVVLIPSEIAVTLKGPSDIPIRAARVEGTLRWDPNYDHQSQPSTPCLSLPVGTSKWEPSLIRSPPRRPRVSASPATARIDIGTAIRS